MSGNGMPSSGGMLSAGLSSIIVKTDKKCSFKILLYEDYQCIDL